MEAATQLFGHVRKILAILDHARRQQDEQLRAFDSVVRCLEQAAEDRNLGEDRYSYHRVGLAVSDQPTKGDSLSTLNGDPALDLALLDGRGVELRGCRRDDVADFLDYLEEHESVRVDPRHDFQYHARVAILNGLDDRRIRIDDRDGRLNGKGNLIADLEPGGRVIHNHQLRRGDDPDIRDIGQGIEHDLRIRA